MPGVGEKDIPGIRFGGGGIEFIVFGLILFERSLLEYMALFFDFEPLFSKPFAITF